MKRVNIFMEDGKEANEKINIYPDICPHCQKGIDVRLIYSYKDGPHIQLS